MPDRKPPQITRIRVRNYRALRDVDIKDLRPFTVLVGPNGSGKSTLFDVFAFLSECFTDGVRRACDRRGGLPELFSRGSSGPLEIEITYQSDVRIGGRPRRRTLSYLLSLDQKRGRAVVDREVLRWSISPGPGRPNHIIDFRQGRGKVADEESGVTAEQELAASDVLAVSALGQLRNHPRVVALKEFVSGWYLSYLSVDDERKPPQAGPQEHLSRSGDNLSNVLQYLKEEHPERLNTVIDQLRRAIPALGEVTYQTSPDGRLILMMRDEPFDQPVLAHFVSDGTLKMLSYLVIFSDPDIAPFIGVEEPENFLYPHLLPGLASLCREAASRSQILVTTHSPEFVDECQPTEVLALYRGEDGYTRVVRPHLIEAVNAMMDSGARLGWLWEAGYFEELPKPRTVVRDSGDEE
ncbi:AAA family ATPase [Thermobifida halotolerans]|uniref:AAA family ATPase n=1 Tax=Thermobifida halotolerans TaxID=483545 RepID=A0A399G6B4_9ACTN|nr:AAA family ATPase [Thermobifida halotolerans]UOE20207.1 AAA family ATPase [Thermobifida halotolerans]